MPHPNYSPPHYLNIADLIIKINYSPNIIFYTEWTNFFIQQLKPFLTPPARSHLSITLTGAKVRGRFFDRRSVKSNIPWPTTKPRSFRFDNCLHPGLFLYQLNKYLEQLLPKHNKLTLHANGAALGNKALLIAGDSGSGKTTTLAKLVPPLIPLGDDRIIVTLRKNLLVAYPSPLNLKADLSQSPNRAYPIVAIIIPQKARHLELARIPPNQALPLIADQLFHALNNKRLAQQALSYSKILAANCYLLQHRKQDPILHLIKQRIPR